MGVAVEANSDGEGERAVGVRNFVCVCGGWAGSIAMDLFHFIICEEPKKEYRIVFVFPSPALWLKMYVGCVWVR